MNIKVEDSSGNLFQDLGFPDAEKRLAKAKIASQIYDLIKKKKLEKNNVCCIGDDLPDIPVFNQAGISIAVADAVEEVRNAADLITKNKGGNGAVREACEFILKSNRITILTLRVILCSIVFKGIMYLGRYYGYYINMTPNDLKLLTGLLIIISLIITKFNVRGFPKKK